MTLLWLQISEPEARRALVETSGHLEGAVEKCVSDRKHKVRAQRVLTRSSQGCGIGWWPQKKQS